MTMEMALERIEECKRTQNLKLDLSGLDLTEIPNKVFTLTQLRALDLSNNKFIDVPEAISTLKKLSSFNLNNNKIKTLPNTITELTDLSILNLRDNQISNLPQKFDYLRQLEFLDLSENRFRILPESVGSLIRLEYLKINDNKLQSLPNNINELKNLYLLDLSNNRFTLIPPIIFKLTRLTILSLWRNLLNMIPEGIEYLVNLRALGIGQNKLNILPKSMSNLTKLQFLYLPGNQLINFLEDFDRMNYLKVLDLRDNNLIEIPQNITNLTRLNFLDLRGNKLPIPGEILANPKEITSIFDYVRALRQDENVPLTEVKILVVGEANVGKTTLIKQLLYEPISIAERVSTRGIIIRHWNTLIKGRQFTLNLWDFGGQEIMHNTHRLFLTTRSCYILVVDATQSEESNNIVKWLKTIHLYAPDAPVILVINKSDQFRLRLNLEALEQHHPIQSIIETSCLTGQGIEHLRKNLETTLTELPHLDDLIPARWMAIRHIVAKTGGDYMDYRDFRAICEAQSVGNTTKSIAEVLSWLGVLFTYSDDLTLKLTHVLNPNWVTEGIYPILTDPNLTQRGGFVTDADIERILDPQRYPPEKHPFILGMMFNFELAFALKPGEYLVPDLLPKSAPPYSWEDTDTIRFVYRYDFLPAGLFSRFVVQMQNDVKSSEVWRSGVVLYQRGNPYALVTVNTDTREITIAITPSQNESRTLLRILRVKFETLHETFPGLQVEEFVPIPGKDVLISYADLLYWESEGQFEQSNRKAGEFNVRDLLDGISDRSMRERHAGMHLGETQNNVKSIVSEEELRQRRRRLVSILTKEIGVSNLEWGLFIDFAGLKRYREKLNFTLDQRNFCLLLIQTLENVGIHPDTNKPALYSLLEELLDQRGEGHPAEAEFLQEWMDEIG